LWANVAANGTLRHLKHFSSPRDELKMQAGVHFGKWYPRAGSTNDTAGHLLVAAGAAGMMLCLHRCAHACRSMLSLLT
jgi:hypothetical protein